MNTQISRRKILGLGLASLGTLFTQKVLAADNLACASAPNAQQPEGPFYPTKNRKDKDNNLVKVDKNGGAVKGEKILFWGRVIDQNCQPVTNALVEIWQACESGRYDHPEDADDVRALDPNFQYWGLCHTDSSGIYFFYTILPGNYPAAENWVRPSHIHMHAQRLGYTELTTQAYFAGNPHNADDKILSQLPPDEQKRCTMEPSRLDKTEDAVKTKMIAEFRLSTQDQKQLAVYQYDLAIKKL
ncbi:MAG: protocatechuate 3,4-dioxygenase [Pseudomonadota bacterium]|nr:protocatechuate 3,4-dioxygenase [Pseudomonadota bacterium]